MSEERGEQNARNTSSETQKTVHDVQETRADNRPAQTPTAATRKVSVAKRQPLTPNQKRLQSLQARNGVLQSTLADLEAEREALALSLAKNGTPADTKEPADVDATVASAKLTVKEHIALLHRYNEIRDVGLGLMGMLADQRGVRLREVQEEFGMDVGD